MSCNKFYCSTYSLISILLQAVTSETTEAAETTEGEGQTEEVPTGEATPADPEGEVQAGEVDTSGIEAPTGSEEPTSSEVPLGEIAAEGAVDGKCCLVCHVNYTKFQNDPL